MAVPLWLLYELGIILATFIVKPVPESAGTSDYTPPTDEEMKANLDEKKK